MDVVAFCALLSIQMVYLITNKRKVLWLLLVSAFCCAMVFNSLVIRLFFLMIAVLALLTARRRRSEVALDVIFRKHPILTVIALAGAGKSMTFRVPDLHGYFALVSPSFAAMIRSNPYGKLEEMLERSSYPELSAVFRLDGNNAAVVVDTALSTVMSATFRSSFIASLAALALLILLMLIVPIIFAAYKVVVLL